MKVLEELGYSFIFSVGIALVMGFIGDWLINNYNFQFANTWRVGALIGFMSSFIAFAFLGFTHWYDKKHEK